MEFLLTFACTGRCKHCSEGEHASGGAAIDGDRASDIVRKVAGRDEARIDRVAHMLSESGVNDLMLSVDAFHQETIPLEPVMRFAKAVHVLGIPKLRVHPAWLVSEDADNPYNHSNRAILAAFTANGIRASRSNVVFPSGNALKYLREYFDVNHPPVNPYAANPHDIQTVCVLPNGDVPGGNIYKTDILEILESYAPEGA